MKQSEIEQKILDFWKKDKTFEKSVERDAPQGDYVFYDGPPFATGTPHYGHIVASLMKDMVPRYWTMRGFRVERRWGWDCHGLPIENIVEKEKGFKHKKDIIEYGVDKFNEDARSKVLTYVDEWEKAITRLGRWVDFDNDYKTMDPEFMESVWWVFKQLYDKGLLYEAYRSLHICPRCETTLAQSEVAQGYQEVTDLSVTAKFKIKSDLIRHPERSVFAESKDLVKDAPVYLLAWTTTPWTLPGNTALAVGDDIEYVVVKSPRHSEQGDPRMRDDAVKNPADSEIYVVAKNRVPDVFKNTEYEVISKIKGKDLVGLAYEPLFTYYDNDKLENRENAFKVYVADFVNTEEGTGIVHIAPAFGADDYGLSQQEKIPFVQHVHMDGTFKDEVTDFAGRFVKHQDDPNSEAHEEKVESTDVSIVKYLAQHNLLFAKQKITHSYPHCWRCDSPLLNYSASSWFVAVEKIKKDLLKNAKEIKWMPEHIKEGRFGQWLAGARDWSISRQRFWGSVIPVWRCVGREASSVSLRAEGTPEAKQSAERADDDTSKGKGHRDKQIAASSFFALSTELRRTPRNDTSAPCGYTVVVGSIKELEELSGEKVTDLHKHFVDKIIFKCAECDGEMRRVPDVLDCWFESGSMPYGQTHYPFENEKKFEENFPAEFIAEGVDQTRAWFYYMHVLATAVKKKPAFKHVAVNGIILAQDGKKMSKRLKNYPDPMDMFEKYGADAVRYYLAASPVLRAGDLNFSEKGVEEVVKKVLLMIYNVLSFYQMYNSDAHGVNSHAHGVNNILDRWIAAKSEQLTKDVAEAYDNYDLNRATRPIQEFVNELSTWYVRRSRERMKDGDADAIATLKFALERLSLVIAPVMPFTAEHLWQEVGKTPGRPAGKQASNFRESVHLQAWPEAGKVDEKIFEEMESMRNVVELALAKRASEGIKIRQPLQKAKVMGAQFGKDYIELIKDELNVKEVECKKGDELIVELNTEITPELRAEGNLRELVRTIQSMRKKAGLTPGDTVTLAYSTSSKELRQVFGEYGDVLKKSVMAKELVEKGNEGEEMDVNGERIKIAIQK